MWILAIGMVPSFLLIWYIYRLDKIEKEPFGLIVKLFVFGGLSTISATILELLFSSILGNFLYSGTILYQIISNFLIIALVEEGGKRFVLRKVTWKNPNFNYRFDAVVYAVTVSLGFAAFENVLYIISYGDSIAPIRAITSIPLHCIAGVFMGHYYGQAKYMHDLGRESMRKYFMALAIIIPVLIHGFYDFCATYDNAELSVVFLIYIVALDIFAYRSVKKFSRQDIEI